MLIVEEANRGDFKKFIQCQDQRYTNVQKAEKIMKKIKCGY